MLSRKWPALTGWYFLLQFKDWFCDPLSGLVESGEAARASEPGGVPGGGGRAGDQLVERLHGVLRPFLLRRLKSEVEKQMPRKHEHVIYCKLSKRQRVLYEDYMSSSETRKTLSGGNFMGMMNVLMQLRKVGALLGNARGEGGRGRRGRHRDLGTETDRMWIAAEVGGSRSSWLVGNSLLGC